MERYVDGWPIFFFLSCRKLRLIITSSSHGAAIAAPPGRRWPKSQGEQRPMSVLPFCSPETRGKRGTRHQIARSSLLSWRWRLTGQAVMSVRNQISKDLAPGLSLGPMRNKAHKGTRETERSRLRWNSLGVISYVVFLRFQSV